MSELLQFESETMPDPDPNMATGNPPVTDTQTPPVTLASLPAYHKFIVHGEPNTLFQRWNKWKRGFNNLMTAMNVSNQAQKRAMLLYFAGEQFLEIFDSLSATGTTYDSAISAFDGYVKPQKNTEFEIYKLRQAKQNPSESIDDFHTRLRKLAENCEFDNTDREIKSQIIQGCASNKLRRKALQHAEYTLSQLLTMARTMEISESQAGNIEHGQPSLLHRVELGERRTTQQPRQGRKCWFCGGNYPHASVCAAKGKICNYCKKPNHFAKMCRAKSGEACYNRTKNESRDDSSIKEKKKKKKPKPPKPPVTQVHHVEPDTDSDSDDDYLYVFGIPDAKNQITMTIDIENTKIPMILDTGCSKDIIDESSYTQLAEKVKLEKTKVKLYPYGGSTPLPLKGKFTANIQANGYVSASEIYVVKGSVGNLLSLSTAQALHLISVTSHVHTKDTDTEPTTESTETISSILEEYQDRFQGIGKLKDFKVKLHTKPDVKPVAQPHRRIPFSLREKVEQKIAELEKADIIEPIEGPTPWISPIVCVSKPHNPEEIRMCVDMRMANTAIERERHLTPTITEVIADVNGSKIYSRLDLNQAYHQLEIAPESRNMTCFSTHVGLRRYKRLFFGVNSASEIFQNAISQALEGIEGVLNLSDDILIYAPNEQKHNETLKKVLQRLREKNLTLNKKKCLFGKSRIEFYGYVFTPEGVSADPKKVEAILSTPEPKSVEDIRSFLGMVNYMGRFIPNMATISQPLRELTKKNKKWKWGKPESNAFKTLKDKLTNADTMSFFDTAQDATLVVDGSPVGVAAMLMQNNKVVAYGSRALSDVEQRYSQTEREALAIKWACDHFRLYVYGRNTEIITDHKPLLALFNNPNSKPPPRIERWMIKLQEYQIHLTFAPGKLNPADFMSRHPLNVQSPDEKLTEDHVNFIISHATPKALTSEQIQHETKNDAHLSKVIDAVQTGEWYKILSEDDPEYKSLWSVRDELCVSANGILLRDNRIVIPKAMREQVVKLAHLGHQGVVKTKALLRTKVWFPGIDKLVQKEVEDCIACQATVAQPNRREPLKMTK